MSLRRRLEVTPLEDRTVPATVTIEAIADATEGGSSGTFRLTRDGSTSSALTVYVEYSGTASGGDYNFTGLASYTTELGTVYYVTIPASSSTADVTVAAVNDSTSEPTETVVMTITTDPGYTVGDPDTATVNILDNDAQYVSVEAISDAAEGGDEGLFRFTRIGDLSSSLTANFSVGGTATSGTDYTSIGTSVVFAAGEATADVSVAALHDTIYDLDETVIATVTSGTGYSVGAQDEATMTIYEDAAHAFTVENNQGAIWYDIPWADVDDEEASQSLELSNFALSLAGHTFTASDASSAPTAQFEYGVFVGITFNIDTSGVTSYPYTSLSMSGLDLTAVPPVGDPFLVAAQVERAALNVDFKNAGGNAVAYKMTVKVETQNGGKADVNFNVPANTTGAQLRDLVYAALKDKKGIEVEKSGDDRLTFFGTKTDQLVRVRFDGTAIQQLNAIKGNPVKSGNVTPKLNINGTDK